MKNNRTYIAVISIIMLFALSLNAQQKAIEKMPEPIGGIRGIADNLQYPDAAKEANIQGKVIIKALVDETGKVIKTSVVKSLHPSCDIAARTAIQKTKFSPGENNGKKVKAEVIIPVSFKLKDKKEK